MFLVAKTEVKRATAGFALSLISGVLVLLNGMLLIVIATRLQDFLNDVGMSDLPRSVLGETFLTAIGAVGLAFGVLILIGSYLIYTPGKETLGGILVLVFGMLSIFTGGGLIVGMILGIIGGALGLAKK
jgi:hypothetical protein